MISSSVANVHGKDNILSFHDLPCVVCNQNNQSLKENEAQKLNLA